MLLVYNTNKNKHIHWVTKHTKSEILTEAMSTVISDKWTLHFIFDFVIKNY